MYVMFVTSPWFRNDSSPFAIRSSILNGSDVSFSLICSSMQSTESWVPV